MFIINLTYKVELAQVDEHLEAHIDYLKQQYANSNFIVSGRKVPRTGGIILSKLKDREELLNILEKDPFKVHGLADYELIEFVPGMTTEEFRILRE